MKRAYLAVTAMLVGPGCSTVQYVPYEQRVPVAVPCVAEKVPEPTWAANSMPRVDPATGEGIDVATKKLLTEREQRKAYEAKLLAANEGCK